MATTVEDLPESLRQVAERVGRGDTYAEAAEELGLSEHTVRNYTRRLSARLPADPYAEMRPKTAVLVWWNNQNTPTAT